ncbi:hypothetical protein RHMOL_Rhmol05G0170400 [Rhododendron molle]|uniref:Uncharacterized protein n=1 Tax=Rhododendron molle TaxID=49168 RepID=A0ACC0NQA4_RHOML|nr:hypothetical protein RHMOL_Rhmol05G0170400 [Rhododendron molle]
MSKFAGCFKLASYHADTVYQNIYAYGIMLIAALATILLVIYNCSDQVLSTRERRKAKSREAAARSVRQKTQAHERWKSTNAAMKHVKGFPSQLSRTFSRRKTVTPTEELRIFCQTFIEIDDDLVGFFPH